MKGACLAQVKEACAACCSGFQRKNELLTINGRKGGVTGGREGKISQQKTGFCQSNMPSYYQREVELLSEKRLLSHRETTSYCSRNQKKSRI